MITVTRFHLLAGLFGTLLLTPACMDLSGSRRADAAEQRHFASPDEAVSALRTAAAAGDRSTLREIFGPESRELVSGDRVEDATDRATFAKAITQFCRFSYIGNDKVVLNIGAKDWPFPIPLVKKDGQWSFDTAAGKNEIINRRVGENELMAIDVCRVYVVAQRDYMSESRDGSGVRKYAQKLKSTAGKKDGLYWEPAAGEAPSPFGPLVASARAEGYGPRKEGEAPQPFHGYLFKILTAQGANAPGGQKNYLVNGDLISGFALVAQPTRWGDSGVMTFIVNQDGEVYQTDLGPDTAAKVEALTAFDPDVAWRPVPSPVNQ